MAKKLVSGLVSLFLCFLLSGLIIKPAMAESQKVTVTGDKATATVSVTIADSSLDGKEVSVVCYSPQWNKENSNWKIDSGCIVYLGQVKVNETTNLTFPINGQVLTGDYYLVIGSGNGKNEVKFNFDAKTSSTAAPNGNNAQLAAPLSLKAVQTGVSQVKLTWGAVDGAVSYSVYRSVKADTGYAKINDVKSAAYTDKKVSAGKTYYYKVTANGLNAAQTSIQSSAAKVRIMKAPVTKLKAAKKSIKVSWKKISGVKGYKVYIATKKNGKYKVKLTVKGASKIKCTLTKLKSRKTYFVKVRAYKINGKKTVPGKFSKVKSVKVK